MQKTSLTDFETMAEGYKSPYSSTETAKEMAKRLPFKIGQVVEAKSFSQGYRGAWFECKVRYLCQTSLAVEKLSAKVVLSASLFCSCFQGSPNVATPFQAPGSSISSTPFLIYTRFGKLMQIVEIDKGGRNQLRYKFKYMHFPEERKVQVQVNLLHSFILCPKTIIEDQ